MTFIPLNTHLCNYLLSVLIIYMSIILEFLRELFRNSLDFYDKEMASIQNAGLFNGSKFLFGGRLLISYSPNNDE